MSTTPRLAEVIEAAMNVRLNRLYTSMPASVESINHFDYTVSVQPLLAEIRPSEVAKGAQRLPIIPDVPLVFPGSGRGRAGFGMTFPIDVDDTVLLIVSHRDISLWKIYGALASSDELATHHFRDSIAIPGLRDLSSQHALPIPTDYMFVGCEKDNAAHIAIHEAEVRLGSNNATTKVALKTDLDTIKGVFTDSAVVAGIAAAFTDGGTSYTIAVNNYFIAHPLLGASKVKAI